MTTARIEFFFFPVGNGDMTLITALGQWLITDFNIRVGTEDAEDPSRMPGRLSARSRHETSRSGLVHGSANWREPGAPHSTPRSGFSV